MTTNYPTSLQSIPNPTSTDLLENATATLDHDYQHGTVNDTVAALQAKVGINGSAVTTSHDYKLSGVTGSDKAASKTGTETLTNKTLTAPQINFGSDTRGDMIVRNSSGTTVRFPIGTSGQILQSNASGDPEWVANPAATDASTSVKGVVEIATTAEITAGTSTGATGAVLVVPADAVGAVGASKLVQFTAATKYPAADGSLITNLPVISTSGVSTGPASSTTQTITHGLGKAPSIIRLNCFGSSTGTNYGSKSSGVYNSSGNRCVYTAGPLGTSVSSTTISIYAVNQTNVGNASGVVGNVTSTTFDIVWTATTNVTDAQFVWEAQ